MKITIRSWQAFVVVVVVLLFGFIWATYKPDAPYKIFSEILWLSFGVYITKRWAQKHPKFGGNNGFINNQDRDSETVHKADDSGPSPTEYIPDSEEL